MTPSDWTGFLLHQVHKVATDRYSSELRQLRLRPLHVGVLQLLRVEGRQVQAKLAKMLEVDKASITTALNQLEKPGYVHRVMHPDDERAYLVSITEEGVAALERAEQVNRRVSTELFEVLSPTEQILFHQLLEKLCDHHRLQLAPSRSREQS